MRIAEDFSKLECSWIKDCDSESPSSLSRIQKIIFEPVQYEHVVTEKVDPQQASDPPKEPSSLPSKSGKTKSDQD